jgi:hypothetical protein
MIKTNAMTGSAHSDSSFKAPCEFVTESEKDLALLVDLTRTQHLNEIRGLRYGAKLSARSANIPLISITSRPSSLAVPRSCG